MSSYKKKPQHAHSRSGRRPNVSAHRNVSADERKFLGGTALNPDERIIFEKGSDELSTRALDLICPIGMGQRALVVSPPGTGKTTILKNIARSVLKGYPDMKLHCVLVDERPEEVTDFKRSVDAKVYASSIDDSLDSHIKVVDTVIAGAYKEAVAGSNVLILIDSLTRLARAHNSQHQSRGRTLSGGVGAGALEVPRRILGAARNVEGMGSITIIATVLIDTGSTMDKVIFEEFKGTGNMEMVLSRDLAINRVFPAIDVSKSGTRRAELLFEQEEFRRLELLRRSLATVGPVPAMEKLLSLLQEYPSNSDLLKLF